MTEGTYSADVSDEPPTVAIASLVAEILDEDVVDLPPLHEVVDTDALEAFVAGGGNSMDARACVQFEYVGCSVTLSADGALTVRRDPGL